MASNIPLPPGVTCPGPNHGPIVLGLCWGFLAPAIIVVALRMFTRVATRSFGWDDATILIALLIAIFGGIANIMQVVNGLGRYGGCLTQRQVENAVHWATAAELQNAIGVFFTKLSISLFLLRILRGTKRVLRIIIIANITVFGIMVAVNVFTYAFQCIPFQGIWDESIKANCIDRQILENITRATNAIDVVTDFLCATIPIFVVRDLKMSRGTKVSLVILFFAGYATAATSIGRAVVANFLKLDDPTWELLLSEYWSLTEENVSITLASLPAIRQLIIYRGRLRDASRFGSTLKSSEPSNSDSQRSDSVVSISEFFRSGPARSGSNTTEARYTEPKRGSKPECRRVITEEYASPTSPA